MAKPSEIQVPDFRRIAEEALKDLPDKVGELAVSFFKASFDQEGFTDFSFMAWPKRLHSYSHPLMRKSMNLQNSIRVSEASLKRVEVSAGEGLPYAELHNQGGTVSVELTDKMRKYFWAMYYKTNELRYKYMALTKEPRMVIKMPQRQFIGESEALNKQIDALFIEQIKQAQKNLSF